MRRTGDPGTRRAARSPPLAAGLQGSPPARSFAAVQAGEGGGRLGAERVGEACRWACGDSQRGTPEACVRRPMHAQPMASHLTAADRQTVALRLLSEQAAIPLDQLARLLGLSLASAVRIVQRLDEEGLVESRRFLVRDLPWLWPSRRGARLSGTGFPYSAPDVALLAHRRAINEVRLYLAERAPGGRWVCERTVFRRRDPEDHLPDAVFEIGGERHAIEAELTSKRNREIRRIVAEHSNRYDAVLYFCGPLPYNLLKRVQAEGRWPKLVVRRVPEGEPC